MPFKVGVSTGLYYIAHGPELATPVKKIGYALTRGTSVIEISGEQPHEVIATEGEQIRHIAKKQGLDINFHGSLTVPMCMPERGEWRNAQEHLNKSFKSAAYAGCNYVNFHACLKEWLELMTYAGRKLTMTFCDHEGNFLSEILKESKDLRDWFIKNRLDEYARDLFTSQEIEQINSERRALEYEHEKELEEKRKEIDILKLEHNKKMEAGKLTEEESNNIKKRVIAKEKEIETIKREHPKKMAEQTDQIHKKIARRKLAMGEPWDSEELRAAAVGAIDGYHIMAHYLFYKKDPVWMAMADVYKDVLKEYGLNYNNPDWLDEAWKEAETADDKNFKEFFYAVCGTKFLEGHMRKLFDWVDKELIKKEFKNDPELIEVAKNLQVCIESPDARDPSLAGMFILWRPKQIYAAIKIVREILGTERIWMLMDYEHVATQGVDALREMKDTYKIAPDFGKYVLAVHSNFPSPLHSHAPLEIGDVIIYELLLKLAESGFGKDKLVYLIYERGGGEDPFQRSIESLKLMVPFLEKQTPVEDLPVEFFGLKGFVAGDYDRQAQIIKEHKMDPLKDLFEVPEEEWSLLSKSAREKGKAEIFKKEELR